MKVRREDYLKYLKPYEEDHIYLDDIEVNPQELEFRGLFHRGRYPYSKNALDYLAASEAVLFVTQFFYVVAGVGLAMQLPQAKDKKEECFINQISADKVHLTALDMKFRKKIEKTDNILLTVRFQSMRSFQAAVHMKADFSIEDSFYGQCSAVMVK